MSLYLTIKDGNEDLVHDIYLKELAKEVKAEKERGGNSTLARDERRDFNDYFNVVMAKCHPKVFSVETRVKLRNALLNKWLHQKIDHWDSEWVYFRSNVYPHNYFCIPRELFRIDYSNYLVMGETTVEDTLDSLIKMIDQTKHD